MKFFLAFRALKTLSSKMSNLPRLKSVVPKSGASSVAGSQMDLTGAGTGDFKVGDKVRKSPIRVVKITP